MRPIRATRVSAIHELPAELPEAEHVLWQGAPAWWQLARSLHIRVVAGYFAVVLAWYGLDGLAHHTPDLMHGLARMAALAACATALFAAYALLVARFTSYTLTNRRLVLQVGIALPISFNIPYSRIAAAAVRPTGGDSGDIVLTLQPGEKLGYFVIWPHARPWRMKHAEPMLRALPEVSRVSRILVPLLTASTAEPVAVSAMADAASPSPQGGFAPASVAA